MDSEDLRLQHEENRELLIAIRDGVNKFIGELQAKDTKPVVNIPDTTKVSGELTVNTQKEVEITNLDSLETYFKDFAGVISSAIENNAYKPLETVKISNPTKSMEISNLKDIKTYFDAIKTAIEKNQPIVNITKQDIVFPTNANKAIPVRLSDGKSFYNAIAQAVSGGNVQSTLIRNTDDGYAIAVVNPDGTNIGGSPSSSGYSNPTEEYAINDIDDASNPKYYGFEKADGGWYIMRENTSTKQYRYAKGDSDYSTNWTNRASQSYATFGSTF